MKTLRFMPKKNAWASASLYPLSGLICTSLLLAGCVASRDFQSPPPPSASSYAATALPGSANASATAPDGDQWFLEGAPVEAQWWQSFGSAQLDAMIEQALRASPTLEAAEATLRQARHTTAAQAGFTRYPQVSASAGGSRQAVTGAAMGQPGGEKNFNLFNASVNVQYEFDLFGGNRRAIEALAAQADFQRFQLEGTRLTLIAGLIGTAITQARLSAQIDASEKILAAQAEQLTLTRQRLALGAVSHSEVLTLQTQMEQTRAAIPALRSELAQATHLLAALTGQTPSEATLPQLALADFTLPSELPLQVPSELVRRRPDIRASEALLHSAHAQYGVALSQLYPQITLSAEAGSQALTADKLFSPGSLIWSLAGQVAQPLFNRGLRAEARAAQAGADAAAAYYRETVLHSFRNVADILRTLEYDAQSLAANTAAERSARETLELIRQRYILGAADYLELLTAQQQAESTRLALFAAQAQRLTDTVAFYSAMGGEWSDDADGEP